MIQSVELERLGVRVSIMGKPLGQRQPSIAVNRITKSQLPASHANRGQSLEQAINITNQAYRGKGLALINKVSTPIKKIRDYNGNMFLAVWERKSSVDYQGAYRGRSVVFEAKSTKEATRFPLDNLAEHQIEYLRAAEQQGAIAFVLVEFVAHAVTYLLPALYVIECWDRSLQGERKSIPHEAVQTFGTRVHSGRGAALDYLAVIDKLWHINEPRER